MGVANGPRRPSSVGGADCHPQGQQPTAAMGDPAPDTAYGFGRPWRSITRASSRPQRRCKRLSIQGPSAESSPAQKILASPLSSRQGPPGFRAPWLHRKHPKPNPGGIQFAAK